MDDALSWAFIIGLTCHAQRHTSQVRCQPPCSGSFACLKSHPGLANRTGATLEFTMASYQNSSSKLCWSFGAVEHRFLLTGGCEKIANLWQLRLSELVLKRGFAVWKREAAKLWAATSFPRRSSFVLGKMEDALSWTLIIDLTCHGQWHTSQVRHQMQW